MTYPGRASMLRAARVAQVAHEDWMQDWPIEVSDPRRLGDFVDLLIAHKADHEMASWLLDLVLDSACAREDLHEWTAPLVEALTAVYRATESVAVAQVLEYWACPDATDPDEFFPVTPVVREVRRRIGHRTPRP